MGVFSYLIYHKCNNLAITFPDSLLFSSAIYSCYLHSASSLVFLFFHSPSLDTNTICHSVTEPVKQRKPLRLSTFRLEQELKDVEGCNDTTQPSTADQGCAVARAESYATRVKNVMRRRWRRGPGKDWRGEESVNSGGGVMQCLRAVNWLLLSSVTDIFLPHTHTESLTQGHFNTNVTISNRPAELWQKKPTKHKTTISWIWTLLSICLCHFDSIRLSAAMLIFTKSMTIKHFTQVILPHSLYAFMSFGHHSVSQITDTESYEKESFHRTLHRRVKTLFASQCPFVV